MNIPKKTETKFNTLSNISLSILLCTTNRHRQNWLGTIFTLHYKQFDPQVALGNRQFSISSLVSYITKPNCDAMYLLLSS